VSLKKVAASMHFEAKQHGESRRVLQRGLQLTLRYRETDIVLSLERKSVPPSEEEVKVCHEVILFGLPLANKAEVKNVVFIAINRESLFGSREDRIAQAISKNVSGEAIRHAVKLFQTDKPTNWSAAEATLQQWEGVYGTKKIIEPDGQVFIPEIEAGRKR